MLLDGYKTYIAGIGLIALGVYQITQGQIEVGVQSIIAGLGMMAIRNAITKEADNTAKKINYPP